MKVYLVQYLCPQRHSIMAAVFEVDDHATRADAANEISTKLAAAIDAIKNRMAELKVDPWCGLCHSDNLTFECMPTKFATMAQAMPILKLAERDNLATRDKIIKGN